MKIVPDTALNLCSLDNPQIPPECLDQLLSYGPCELYSTLSNALIITLPTRTLPIYHFIEENWETKAKESYGNVRNVFLIKELIDRTKTNLFIKSPERVFTTDLKRLNKYDFWQRGKRSGEKHILIKNNPAIEEQAFWETIFLLELAKNKIKAEIPQAILITSPTEYRIIVEGIVTGFTLKVPVIDEIVFSIKSLGIMPVDLTCLNVITDGAGYPSIIDTNRWSWPPRTDNLAHRMLEAIKQQISKLT